jgi:hypothetical protein
MPHEVTLPPLPRRGVKSANWSGRTIRCVSLPTMQAYARQAVLEERERCARLATEVATLEYVDWQIPATTDNFKAWAEQVAAAIRKA